MLCITCVFTLIFESYHHLDFFFFFSSRRRHTRSDRDWSSDVCSSDLPCGRGDLRSRPPPRKRPSRVAMTPSYAPRSEERREGKSVDLGGRRIIKKKKKKKTIKHITSDNALTLHVVVSDDVLCCDTTRC